ncbi:FtsK/SpoIIIE domain-containing protein [Paractinoplanes toevensis]|uniref:Type VII secretion protein EccC n=1 Tax=Paractinoplanes toevensis TaxID=571911 RepID=A0A919TI32_9ACTN|nr:FtsK/SpoIIIE domain-containing protein [Actinoplanes toevensis]GIM95622.1 type VII secretion protein EccC [Actinoplanes toevensis]
MAENEAAPAGRPVHRPARVADKRPPARTVDLEPLPVIPDPPSPQITQFILPVLGSGTILIYGWLAHSTIMLITGGVVVGLSLLTPFVTTAVSRRSQKRRVAASAEAYGKYLDGRQEAVADHKRSLLRYLRKVTPTSALLDVWIADYSRVWSRRLRTPDFLTVAVGEGRIPTGLAVKIPTQRFDQRVDERLRRRCETIEESAAWLEPAPVTIDLYEVGVLSVEGDRAAARGVARTVLLQLAAGCGPDELHILLTYAPGGEGEWAGFARLPHVRSATADITALTASLHEILRPRAAMLNDPRWTVAEASLPHVVLLIDPYDPLTELSKVQELAYVMERSVDLGVSVIAMSAGETARPSAARAVVECRSASQADMTWIGPGRRIEGFRPDVPGTAMVSGAIQQLAGMRLVADESRATRRDKERLVDLLEVYFQHSPFDSWPRHDARTILRMPIGTTTTGADLVLDLKEAAAGGHGPHGLVVGATGSGKSELLRSMVCAMACTHSPAELNILLLDFKGGATFDLLQDLPHCVGMVTNLVDDLSLIDRIEQSLTGELTRRQEDLRLAGREVQKLEEYEALRSTTKPWLRPIPYLTIVIDEFGELLSARPDFLEILISIARTGRSLGVHLILASQRLEAGRLRGLDTYLGYRLCLRTFTADESIAVLGVRDAANLPPLPGHGFYRSADGMVQFRASQVLHRDVADPADETDAAKIVAWLSAVDRAEPLLLLPLPEPLAPNNLEIFDDRLAGGEKVGLVALGLIDRPADRAQPPLRLDFSASGGHQMFVGGPRSGKSTVVRSLILAAVRSNPGSHLRFFVVEAAPNVTAYLDDFPNVGSAALFTDALKVRRIFEAVARTVERNMNAIAEATAGTGPPRVKTVLVVDGYLAFRERFPDLEDVFARIVADGAHAGVHVVVTSGRWADMQPKRLEQIADRYELWLTDPAESAHPRAVASTLGRGRPGRGLTADAAFFQIAADFPFSADGAADAEYTAKAIGSASRRAAEAHHAKWPGATADRLSFLTDMTAATWAGRADAVGQGELFLGVSESGLATRTISLGSGDHMICTGDPHSGRTTFLARMLSDLLRSNPRALFYVVDFRAVLTKALGLAGTDRAHVARDEEEAKEVVRSLAIVMEERELERRRDRSGPPSGTPALLVVEDYELVLGSDPMALQMLSDCLPYGQELNLTVLLTQSAYGASARMDGFSRRAQESMPFFLEFSTSRTMDFLPSRRKGRTLPFGQAFLVRDGAFDERLLVLPPSR